jgi:hypothetical protein
MGDPRRSHINTVKVVSVDFIPIVFFVSPLKQLRLEPSTLLSNVPPPPS